MAPSPVTPPCGASLALATPNVRGGHGSGRLAGESELSQANLPLLPDKPAGGASIIRIAENKRLVPNTQDFSGTCGHTMFIHTDAVQQELHPPVPDTSILYRKTLEGERPREP